MRICILIVLLSKLKPFKKYPCYDNYYDFQKSSALDKIFHRIQTSKDSSQLKMKTMNPSNLFQSKGY